MKTLLILLALTTAASAQSPSTKYLTLPEKPKIEERVQPRELTPQERIDAAFTCLALAQRGYQCEGNPPTTDALNKK